jgi:hypothetical protein
MGSQTLKETEKLLAERHQLLLYLPHLPKSLVTLPQKGA